MGAAAALWMALGAGAAHAASILVVASPKFGAATVTEEELRQLYLGKAREVSGVGTVTVLDLPAGNAVHDEFARRVLDKSPRELSAYWSVRIFSGRGTPPQTVADVKDVKAWLAAHPDAIGSLDAASVDASVKVLLELH